MIDGSTFLLVDMEDIEPPEDYEPNQADLERMKRSISECSLGVIHLLILVGAAPPFHLGAGRLRYTAARALGLPTIPARLVSEWDELIRIDEDYVRRHYDQAEVEHLRQLRDRLIAEKKAEGKSNVQIGKELGISDQTVRRRSMSTNVDIDHPDEVTQANGRSYPAQKSTRDKIEQRRANVRALKAEGLSNRAIAERLEVSTGTVQADLKAPDPAANDDPKSDEYEGLDLEYQGFEDPARLTRPPSPPGAAWSPSTRRWSRSSPWLRGPSCTSPSASSRSCSTASPSGSATETSTTTRPS